MRKLLVLLTVMVAVLCLTAVGFAQTLTCHNCKCALRAIPCATSTQVAAGTCLPFDFDLNAVGDGYTAVWAAPTNCRAIFAICDCPDPTVFVAGLLVQVRMEIMVAANATDAPVAGDNGAYWSGANGAVVVPATIDFDTYPTLTAACADTVLAKVKSFGAQTYYLSDGITTTVPMAGTACAVTSRGTILQTAIGTAYKVIVGDGPYWMIDIPPIRIAPASIASNSVIYVKITLIDTAGTSICTECTLCECLIAVAQVCPSAVVAPTSTLTFPYFTSLASGDYWNGIAISNPSSADKTCALTAYQMGGGTCTATITVPATSMFVDLVENIAWTGTVNGAACYVKALCQYGGAFGFGMMSNGNNDSMGYLPWLITP